MFRSFRLGRIFGFPVDVNMSFLLLLALVLFTMGGWAGVFVVLLSFASVLAHELGHALVARQRGVRVAGISLHFFGGAARLIESPKNAGDEIAIAAAGPAVSFALAGLAALGIVATHAPIFHLLAWVNLFIGGFNLLPALPMDGGRILRAALTRRLGYVRATDEAVRVARVVAGGLLILGLVKVSFYLVALAVVLWLMASAERAMARMGGYRGSGEVEVLPRDAYRGWQPGHATAGYPAHRPVASGGFVIRREGNRFVIEPIE